MAARRLKKSQRDFLFCAFCAFLRLDFHDALYGTGIVLGFGTGPLR